MAELSIVAPPFAVTIEKTTSTAASFVLFPRDGAKGGL